MTDQERAERFIGHLFSDMTDDAVGFSDALAVQVTHRLVDELAAVRQEEREADALIAQTYCAELIHDDEDVPACCIDTANEIAAEIRALPLEGKP